MPTQHHLALRSAMHEHHGGMTNTIGSAVRKKELPVNLQSIGRLEDDLLGSDHAGRGKTCGNRLWRQILHPAAARNHRWTHGNLRVGTQHRDSLIVARNHRRGFNASSLGQLLGRSARSRKFPDMTTIDVILVRGVDDGFAVWAHGNVLDNKIPWRQ